MDTASNNLLLGFAGNAYSGKDTANRIIQEAVALKWGKRNFDSIPLQKLFYSSKASNLELSNNESDAFILYRSFLATDKNIKVHFFNIPLANEVKRIYVEKMLHEGTKLSFERLLNDSAYKAEHRQGLIEIGDGYRQKYSENIWLNKIDDVISMIAQDFQSDNNFNVFSITDLRYTNEPIYLEQTYEHIMPILTSKVNAKLTTRLARMTEEQAYMFLKKHKNNASERNIKRLVADFELDNNGNVEHLSNQIHKDIMPCINLLINLHNV